MISQKFINSKLIEILSLIAFMTLGLGSIIILQSSKLTQLIKFSTPLDYQKQEQLEKVKLDVLNNIPTFGFNNLVADWTLLQFIQYFADDPARKATGYSLSPDYLNLIVKNEPRFVRAYLILSPITSINAGRPDRTVAEMEKGLKILSPDIYESYLVWLYKGVDEMLFLGDIESAKNSYQMASNWADIAGDKKIAAITTKTAKFLETNPDSKNAQVGAWFMVLVNTSDRETQKRAKDEIEKLGGQLIFYPDGRVSVKSPQQD